MANRFHTSRLIEIEARRAGRGELRNPPSLARRASMTTTYENARPNSATSKLARQASMTTHHKPGVAVLIGPCQEAITDGASSL
jgi:hypothetical protein